MATHKDSRARDARRAMREASRLPQPSIVDIDPEEPTQLLDDVGQYSVVDLDLGVEAQPHAEADALIDAAIDEPESGEGEDEGEDELEASLKDEAEVPMKDKDTGDLYGVHQPPGTDKKLDKTRDQEAFLDADQGENWLETLGHKSVEYGPEAEHQIDVIDDSDEHLDHRGHHSTESGDKPVADKGSGGDGGL